MAKNTDFKLPFNDLISYVPQKLRKPMISSLIDNLFNRFLTHDESIPLFGYAGKKPALVDDKMPKIPQMNADRDINSIIPVFNFDVGNVKHTFTFTDIINRAKRYVYICTPYLVIDNEMMTALCLARPR